MNGVGEAFQKAARRSTYEADEQEIYTERYAQPARAGRVCASSGTACQESKYSARATDSTAEKLDPISHSLSTV